MPNVRTYHAIVNRCALFSAFVLNSKFFIQLHMCLFVCVCVQYEMSTPICQKKEKTPSVVEWLENLFGKFHLQLVNNIIEIIDFLSFGRCSMVFFIAVIFIIAFPLGIRVRV